MKNELVEGNQDRRMSRATKRNVLELLALTPVNIVSCLDGSFPRISIERSRIACSYDIYVVGNLKDMILEKEEGATGEILKKTDFMQPEKNEEGETYAYIQLNIRRKGRINKRVYSFFISSSPS